MISVAVDEQLREVQVTVQDNGIGMTQEVQEQIFSLFYSSKGHQGTGLGLAVSDKILHEHGGGIQVESSAGEGSRFVLHWPHDLEASG
jgi:signal transduction histidine kinase